MVCIHAQDFQDKHPAAALGMLVNMYMDDIQPDSEDSEGDALHVWDDLMRPRASLAYEPKSGVVIEQKC